MTKQAERLKKKIVEVIGRIEYQPGYPKWDGIHILKLPKKPGAQSGVTWCNEAANKILVELGYNTKSVLDIRGIGWTNANSMHKRAEKAAQDRRTGILEISAEFAQGLANAGGCVLVTAYNDKGPGHIGIVCPDENIYSHVRGPLIGQAGAANGIRYADKSFPGLSVPKYYLMPIK